MGVINRSVSVESICLMEAAHLVRRSIKYWHLIGKMYLESLRDHHPAQVFRAAYFFCRHIDDVLDGDRKVTADPEMYVRHILSAMKTGHRGPQIVDLYRFAIDSMKEMAAETDRPMSYFMRVIEDAMLFDFERGKERRVLTRTELESYYNNTFTPITDIALIISGSHLRTEHIPEIVTTQGHIYTVRDMKKDLEKGIINIPLEELEKAEIDGVSASYNNVRRNPMLASWMDDEVRIYQHQLQILKGKLSDEGSRKVVLPLIWQMDMYCKLYQLGLQK